MLNELSITGFLDLEFVVRRIVIDDQRIIGTHPHIKFRTGTTQSNRLFQRRDGIFRKSVFLERTAMRDDVIGGFICNISHRCTGNADDNNYVTDFIHTIQFSVQCSEFKVS